MHHKEPDDFVVATEENFTVKEFAENVFSKLGLSFKECSNFNDKYLRPNEVPDLRGDASKAHKILGWKPETKFENLIDIMIEAELKEESRNV